MKKIKKQIEQSKLLAGKVLGHLSEEDKQTLADWENDAKNKIIEEEILNVEAFQEWNDKMDRLDTSESYRHFLNKMNETSSKSKLIHLPIYKRIITIAASIIILISIGLVFLVDEIKQDEVIASSTELVKTGEFKATLTLSTGEKVRLSENVIDSITDKGHTIEHFGDEGINYSKSDGTEKLNQTVVYNTLKVARGEEYKIVLADGTKVWLNADSELKYPVQFGAKLRSVFLKGEAYFDVAHNKSKAFVVNAHDQKVRVYGTEFCIDAYVKEEIKTVLVEGSVGVKANEFKAEVRINPGELSTVNVLSGETEVKKVNVRPYIAWKDGDFVFEHERLESIMMKLERWYDVKIFYKNAECKDYKFTGDVKRYNDIQNILNIIQLTSKAKFEVNKNTIVVMTK